MAPLLTDASRTQDARGRTIGHAWVCGTIADGGCPAALETARCTRGYAVSVRVDERAPTLVPLHDDLAGEACRIVAGALLELREAGRCRTWTVELVAFDEDVDAYALIREWHAPA